MRTSAGNKASSTKSGSFNARRSWADVVKPTMVEKSQMDADYAISRDELLARRALSMNTLLLEPNAMSGLRTESSAIVSPLLRPSPPPGLEDLEPLANQMAAHVLEDEACPMPENTIVPKPELPPEPEQFKVLLENLPEAMLKECMLRVMLEQAKLQDVTHLAFRANGKALITFTSYASVCQCIAHFSGRQWGTCPVIAMYVRTCKKDKHAGTNEVQEEKAAAKLMSADAPVFVPGKFTATAFSLDAPVFVPSSEKIGEHRGRFYSSVSTDVGPMSDVASNCDDSENEVQIACT